VPGAFHLLNRLVRAVLYTYEAPAGKLGSELHYYEDHIFLKDKTPPVLEGVYFLKRKVDLIRRMLILSRYVVENIDVVFPQ
jgi:magnesium transporter